MPNRTNSRLVTAMLGALAGLLVLCIILYPDKAFQSSLQGLQIWWKIVFPALMPFLIMTELLTGFGILHGFGVFLEPFMRLLFRLPGAAGFAVSIGAAAGYPAGAELAARLRQDALVTRQEGERLLALSYVGNPVLLVGVIGVGFLHNATTGMVIAAVHYMSAMAAGLAWRLGGSAEPAVAVRAQNPLSMLRQCVRAMEQARSRDGRSFGKLLGDAVTNSVQTLLMIGGYMMIFSVIANALRLVRFDPAAQGTVDALTSAPGTSPTLLAAALTGILEVHLGAYGVSQAAATDSAVWAAALLGAVLAWGGLAYHAQVQSAIHRTDLRYSRFLFSRMLHAVFAVLLTFALWRPLSRLFAETKPSFLHQESGRDQPIDLLSVWNGWAEAPSLWLQAGQFLAAAAAASLAIGCFAILREKLGRKSRT